MQPTKPAPAIHDDGTLAAQIVSTADPWGRLRLRLPGAITQPRQIVAGRYVLARCAAGSAPDREADWGLYLRRPLFLCGHQAFGDAEEWCVYLPPDSDDPGYAWLARLPAGATINLIGPLGNGFHLHPNSHNLLLLADLSDDAAWLAWLMPLVEPALDRGGRVTLLVRVDAPLPAGLLGTLPLALEVQTAQDETEWQAAIAETLRWADQICAGIPAVRYSHLHQTIHTHRFHAETGFAQVLVKADLLCGVGACLACVVPLPHGGLTRACVHGPVFDLARVAG